jgi:hypothetical protein
MRLQRLERSLPDASAGGQLTGSFSTARVVTVSTAGGRRQTRLGANAGQLSPNTVLSCETQVLCLRLRLRWVLAST